MIKKMMLLLVVAASLCSCENPVGEDPPGFDDFNEAYAHDPRSYFSIPRAAHSWGRYVFPNAKSRVICSTDGNCLIVFAEHGSENGRSSNRFTWSAQIFCKDGICQIGQRCLEIKSPPAEQVDKR